MSQQRMITALQELEDRINQIRSGEDPKLHISLMEKALQRAKDAHAQWLESVHDPRDR